MGEGYSTIAEAEEVAARLEWVGYAAEVVSTVDSLYAVKVVDNSGWNTTIRTERGVEEALADMELNGEAIAEGYSSLDEMEYARRNPIHLPI